MSVFMAIIDVGRLERDAAAVERDALADEHEVGQPTVARTSRAVRELDEPRWAHRSHAHGEDAAEPLGRQLVLVAHPDSDAGRVSDRRGLIGQPGRRLRR